MAQFKDVIDPKDLKRLMGGPSVINQPSTIEYDTKAFKRADPLAAITGGMRGLEESRALSQSGLELAAKGLGNIVENVVFETLKAPGTILSGIGTATGAEPLVNNFWYQSFDAIQQATLGKITEVYVPPSVQDKGLWGQIFNPYFFAGEGADAVGTMLSMMIPGRWMATLGTGDRIAKALSKAGRLGDLAADGTKMITELGDANKFGKFLVKTLGSTGRGVDFGKLARNIDSGVAVTVNTLLESSAEALDTYETLLDQGKSPEEASQIASKVLGLNMALLTVSNTLLEKYVFNGFNRMPTVSKQLATALKGGKPVFRPVQQAGVKFGAGVLAEGFVEEGLQTTFQQEEGNFMNSIERYMDNLTSLFGDDPDIEFGKAVFLGGVLGGTVGGISGISDVKQQQQLLQGRPARQLTGTKGKIQAMLGYKAREAEKGLIDVFLPSFEALKSGKDKLKGSALTGEKIDPKTLEDETLMFALSNTFDDLVESNNGNIEQAKNDLKVILSQEYQIDPKSANILVQKVAPVSNLSSSTAFDLMRAKKDYMYFSRFAANPAGFEMLDAHIDDMVEAMSERYTNNTGMQMSDAAKVKLQNDMKQKAKKFKNIYEAGTKYNTNIRFDVEFTEDQRGLFNEFMNIVQTDSLNAMMFKSDLEEQVKNLEEETKLAKAEIDRATSINNNKQQSPDLSKEEKEQAQKDFEQQIAQAKGKVPDYDAKINDIKLLNTEIAKKSEAVLNNGLADRVKEKWKKFLELQNEVAEAKKLFFDGVEIDFTNMVEAMNTIERILRDKGYEPMRDPNTGIVVLDPFYIKQNNKTYVVHAKPEGINYEELGAQPATQKPITWENFITTRNKATILTIGEFTEIKANYDAAIKEEEDLLMVEAIIKAIVKQSSLLEKQLEANKQALSDAKTKAKEFENQIEDLKVKSRVRKSKKLDRKQAEQIREKAKELLKGVEASLKTTNENIQNLEPYIATLEGQLAALQNLKGFVERNRDMFKGKTFQDIYTQTDLTSMIAGLQPDEVVSGSELVQRGFADNDMTLLDEFLRNTKNLLDELGKFQDEANELRTNLRKLRGLLDTIIAETTIGSLRNNVLPDEIAEKYLGLRDVLNEVGKINDSKPLLDYLAMLSASIPNGDYAGFIKQFVSTVSPYLPLSTQELEDYKTSMSDRVVNELDQLNAKTLPDRTTALLSRFAIVERFRNELEATRQKVFNKLKKNYKAVNQQTPSWDLDSPEPGFEQDVDERLNRTEHLFNTSGLNIQFDPDSNRDLLTPMMGTSLFVPLVTNDIYQQAFFNWLDEPKQDGFKVLPYAPSYTDEDFTDITDPQTAEQLREAIKNTPKESRSEALYTVIVDEEGNVMKFNNIPLINSMMLPSTKFPDDKPSRMARRIVLSEFLSDVYGTPVDLKTTDLSSTAKITKQGLDRLAEYGIEIQNTDIDRKTFFEILDPYAKIYMRKKYSDELADIREKSKQNITSKTEVLARNFLDVKGISNGTLITAKDEKGKAVASPIETLGLEFNRAGVPTNFTIVKANRKGEGDNTVKNKKYTGLKPGTIYIDLDNRSGLIPVELRNLDQNEVDVILYMLSQIDPSVKTLDKTFPDLEGSIFVKGEDRNLNEIPMLPTMKDRTSLMSFIMNWGFKSKDGVTPYDIYISKGNIVFGKTDSISVADFRKAYEQNDTVALQPLMAFLLNKRVNANHLLLNNRSTKFYTFVVETTKDGKKKLKAVQKQGSYANHILTGASTYALPQQMREMYNLPMFAQRYLYFKQGTAISPEAYKQEVATRKTFVPQPKAGAAPNAKTKMQQFRSALDTITNEGEYGTIIGTYATVPEIFNLVQQVVTLPTFQEKVNKLKELIDGTQVAEEQEVTEGTPKNVFIQVVRGIKTSNNPSDETVKKRAAILSLIVNEDEPTDEVEVMKDVLSQLKVDQDPWLVSLGNAVEGVIATYPRKPITYIKPVLRTLVNDAKKKPGPKAGSEPAATMGTQPAATSTAVEEKNIGVAYVIENKEITLDYPGGETATPIIDYDNAPKEDFEGTTVKVISVTPNTVEAEITYPDGIKYTDVFDRDSFEANVFKIAEPTPVSEPARGIRNPVVGDTLLTESLKRYTISDLFPDGSIQWKDFDNKTTGTWTRDFFNKAIAENKLQYSTLTPEEQAAITDALELSTVVQMDQMHISILDMLPDYSKVKVSLKNDVGGLGYVGDFKERESKSDKIFKALDKTTAKSLRMSTTIKYSGVPNSEIFTHELLHYFTMPALIQYKAGTDAQNVIDYVTGLDTLYRKAKSLGYSPINGVSVHDNLHEFAVNITNRESVIKLDKLGIYKDLLNLTEKYLNSLTPAPSTTVTTPNVIQATTSAPAGKPAPKAGTRRKAKPNAAPTVTASPVVEPKVGEVKSVTVDNIDSLTSEEKKEVIESNGLIVTNVQPGEEVTTEKVKEAVEKTNEEIINNTVDETLSEEDKADIAKEVGIDQSEVNEFVKKEVKAAVANNGKVKKGLGAKTTNIISKIVKFLMGGVLALILYYNTGQIRAPHGTLNAIPNTTVVEASFLPSTFSNVDFDGCQMFVNNQVASTVGRDAYKIIGMTGHAWTATGNMVNSGGGTYVYNAFKGYVRQPGLTYEEITSSLKQQIINTKSQININSFREGDIVNLFYEGSWYTKRAYNEGLGVYTSHVGMIKKSPGGKLVLEHNIQGRIFQDDINKVLAGKVYTKNGQMLVSAIARPNYNRAGVFLQPDVKGYTVDTTSALGQQFLDNLFTSKSQLLRLYRRVTSAEYDKIAKLAYATFGQESSFGTYGRARGKIGYFTDIMQLDAQRFGSLTGIDYFKSKNPSVGVTQIRITSINPKVREELNIKKSSDLLNIEKAAQATMAVLLDIYVNEIPSNLKQDYAKLLPLGYNNKTDFKKAVKGDTSMYNNQYVKNINSIADLVKFKSNKDTTDLRRDPNHVLKTALKRGIIDKVNCK